MPLPLTVLCGPSSTLRDTLVHQLVSRRSGLVAVVHDTDELTTRSVVRRRVLDMTGTIEDSEVELAHGCVSCTIRQDMLPTLLAYAESGRWTELLLGLPVPVLPRSVITVLEHARADSSAIAEAVRLDGVTTLVDAVLLLQHLHGDERLATRGLGAADSDPRTMAGLVCAQIEQADVVAVAHLDRVDTPTARTVEGLLAHLTPLAVRVALPPDGTGCEQLVSTGRAGGCDAEERTALAALAHQFLDPVGDVNTVVWGASEPLHPHRLHQALTDLVPAVVRSTGHVQLANRPGATLRCESSAATLSMGLADPDEVTLVGSELVLTSIGLCSGRIADVLDSCLLSPAERGTDWSSVDDPFATAVGSAEDAERGS